MANFRSKVAVAIGFVLLVGGILKTEAQTSAQSVPQAPVPAQIISGRKAFISNGGSDGPIPSLYDGGPNRAYNQFYAALKDWEHYEIVSTPSDADLVFEIRVELSFAEGWTIPYYGFKAIVWDPKTHVRLWTVSQRIQGGNRPKTIEKNYDQAIVVLVEEIKKLAAGAPLQK